MIKNWSIQKKILIPVALVLVVALLIVGVVSGKLFKSALTERMEKYELVRTVEAIRNELDKTISIPQAQARQLASNTFLLDWMASGENADGIKHWERYAQALKKETGAAMISWTSETTLNYYDDHQGLARKIDPNGKDAWFAAFLASGKPSSFNLGREAGQSNVMLFVNALAKDEQGHRAIASLGIDVTVMAERIKKIAVGKTGQVYVVNEQGQIQLHRDPAMVNDEKKIDFSTLPGLVEAAPQLLKKSDFNLTHYQGAQGPMIIASSYLASAGWFVVVEISEAEVYAAVDEAVKWQLLVDGLVLLVSLALIFAIAKSISQPLSRLNVAMRSLASGQGDLTARLHVDSRDEIGEVASSFNTFIGQLHSMFVRVRDQSNHLKQSVDQLGHMAEHLSQGSQASAALAESTAATIEEITVSVGLIADNTREAAISIEEAGSLSSTSAQSVERVSGEISSVSDSMAVLTDAMAELENRSGQIGSIARVIKEIAEQTNLLALNAAIEAARAGEQGRGFAVVADEVRKLAERTGLATIEIDQMVSAMRDASSQAMGNVSKTHESVRSGVNLVQIALQHIGEIELNMRNVIGKTAEIRDAASEQSRATEEMAKTAERLSSSAQEGNHEINQARAVTAQLERLSMELNQVVGSFRL